MKKKILVLAGILMGCGLFGQVQMAAGGQQTLETAKRRGEGNQAAARASELQVMHATAGIWEEPKPERTAAGIWEEPERTAAGIWEEPKPERTAAGIWEEPERTAKGIQDDPQAELVRVGEKKEEFEASGVLVHINAQVEAYEGEVPVVKVKPHILTSQELKQWKEVLFPETDLYEYFGTEERKAVYSFHNMDYLLGETAEDVLPGADEPHDLFFHASRMNNQCVYELRSVERTVEGKKLHCIEAGNYAREKGQLPYKACSEREAEKTALDTVEALDLSDWRLTDVWSDDDGCESCCHIISFSRLYGGIPASGKLAVQDEKHAVQSLSLEALTVRVENGVVTEVRLDNPMEMAEVEKTELLPFDTVCACFKNEFGKRDMKKSLTYEIYERPDGSIREDYHEADVRVAIHRITMGFCPVKDGEKGGELRMVPVWMFSGIYSVDGNAGLTDGDVPIMVLNAIDGSVLEGNLGYRQY